MRKKQSCLCILVLCMAMLVAGCTMPAKETDAADAASEAAAPAAAMTPTPSPTPEPTPEPPHAQTGSLDETAFQSELFTVKLSGYDFLEDDHLLVTGTIENHTGSAEQCWLEIAEINGWAFSAQQAADQSYYVSPGVNDIQLRYDFSPDSAWVEWARMRAMGIRSLQSAKLKFSEYSTAIYEPYTLTVGEADADALPSADESAQVLADTPEMSATLHCYDADRDIAIVLIRLKPKAAEDDSRQSLSIFPLIQGIAYEEESAYIYSDQHGQAFVFDLLPLQKVLGAEKPYALSFMIQERRYDYESMVAGYDILCNTAVDGTPPMQDLPLTPVYEDDTLSVSLLCTRADTAYFVAENLTEYEMSLSSYGNKKPITTGKMDGKKKDVHFGHTSCNPGTKCLFAVQFEGERYELIDLADAKSIAFSLYQSTRTPKSPKHQNEERKISIKCKLPVETEVTE